MTSSRIPKTGQESKISDQIIDETRSQTSKWGEQNYPNGTSADLVDAANDARAATNQAARDGSLTWLDILVEEVSEAAAEEDPIKLRAELIQVAAVAASWIDCIDRRI